MSDDEIKILCPFCNAEWTAEMDTELESYNAGCETCGYGAEATFSVTIRCSNCNRIVYRKECESRG